MIKIIALLGIFSAALYAEPLPRELLSPYTTAWLEIPHTPHAVLIGFNSNETTTPSVKTVLRKTDNKTEVQFRANFSFVDPSIYDTKIKSFKHLPEGLYHWKDDAALPASQELKRLGNKANPQVAGNNFLVRPYPKCLTGFALNSSGSDYVHLTKDGAAWEPAHAMQESFAVLKRIIADLRLPKWSPETYEFQVASINALFSVNSKGTPLYRGGMAADKREKLFGDLLTGENILSETDILCVQEAHGLPRAFIEQYGYEFAQDLQQLGLLIAFNPNKFDLVQHENKNFCVAGAQHKGFIAAILDTKELENNKRIGVINIHAQSAAGSKDINPTSFRQEQLKDVVRYIHARPTITHWIVCGDLNIDGLDATLYQTVADTLSQANLTINPNSLNLPTAVYAHKDKDLVLRQNDYIFVTPTLSVASFNQFPVEAEQLLTQRSVDAQAQYFSDHAVIKTALTFAEDEDDE